MLYKRFQQFVALMLSVALLVPLLPPEALAHYADDAEKPTSIVRSDGTTEDINEDWVTAFPYGTFAFDNSEAQVTEGGDPAVIRLYRLGGTKGRATAVVSYVPAVTQIAEDKLSYGNAAGLDDVVIEVEDTLPIAKYQPLGKDPDPEPTTVKLVEAESGAADAQPGDRVFTLTEPAEEYRWYVLSDGKWELVQGANEPEFVISGEAYEELDVRCVFTADGVRRCTDSVKGAAYEKPAQEALDEMPADLPLNPDTTFTALAADDPYGACTFTLTFAEDEWVKDIRVTARDDDAAEAIKAGTFTIVDCEGGTLYDAANTLALAVFDNEAPEESVIGFAVTEVDADKSAGVATLTVTRTGGTQTMVTVPYSTEDGTARAGEDYQAASGSLAFYADVTEQTIEIPLIDDGAESSEPVTFRVALGGVVGDNQGLVTMENTVATVSLTNSNTAAAANLATLLRDGSAVDASGSVTEAATVAAPVERKVVTGTQVKSEGEPLSAAISGMDGDDGSLSLQTYDYGRITFSRGNISNYNSKYWRNNLMIADDDYTFFADSNSVGAISWTGDGSGSGARKIEGKSGGKRASLTVPYMSQMYNYIYARLGYSVAIKNTDLYGAEFVYPWAAVRTNDDKDAAYSDAGVTWDWGLFSGYHYKWKTSGAISHSFDMSSNLEGITIGLSKHDAHDADKGNAKAEITSLYLTRRNLENDLQLRIHTANDGESGGANVPTAPEKAAALNAGSGVYASMKPDVTIVEGNGGVNSSGKIYVGSTVEVKLKNTDSYRPLSLKVGKLDTAVYVSDANGNVVSGPQITKKAGTDSYTIRMVWDGMREADLSKTYVINVVMTRRQALKLDLAPSVPRQENNPSAIDTNKIGTAWTMFWNSKDANSAENQITYGVSDATTAAPHFSKTGVSTKSLKQTDSWTTDTANAAGKMISGVENLQWINFNRSEEDRILYNGRIYAGNETIYLDMADLALPNATFRYYHRDYLSAASIMTTDINSIGVYFDTNGNGRIDGYFNRGTGYFVLDPAGDNFVPDDFIQFLDPDTDYDETTFAPVKVGDKYVQQFAKVLYTMTPRALIPPVGMELENEHAQVLPAFVTNITDPDNYAALTREQKAYRYIMSGMNQSAASMYETPSGYARSSDGHEMYGALANIPQIIDVPLGGDVSPAHLNAEGDGYDWTPDYQGNLLVDFTDPEPISIEHSVAGDDIPVEDYTINEDGTVTLQSGGAKLNGYLGSFTANSTITLCTQRQEKTAEQLHTATAGSMALLSDEKPGITPEASNLSTRGTFPNSEYLKAMESGADTDDPSIDMGDSPNEFDELNLDLGVKLPSTDIGITDYVTLIMDGYEVGFAIGLPLASASKEDGKKGFVDTNKSKGEDMGKMKNFLQNRKGSDVDDSYKNAKNGSNLNTHNVEASLSVSVAFLFKYNSVDNGYYFSQFAIALTGSVEFKYQHRFAAAPVVYLYVKVGAELKLGTGATVERQTVESEDPWSIKVGNEDKAISDKDPLNLSKGQVQFFYEPQYKAQDITFKGKIAIQLQQKDGTKWKDVPKSVKGYLQSDGGDPVTVTLLKQDEMKLPNESTVEYRIKVTALEDSTITGMVEVVDMSTLSYWSGFTLEPSVFVEAGAGIGIEILKFEIFIKVSVECAMTFGAYNEDKDDYDPFVFNSFNFGLGLGFRVVLLVFNYEMDLIGYSVDFDQEARDENHSGWSHSWHALGDLFGGEIGELSAVDRNGNYYGVKISLPGDTSRTQTIYSNEDEGGLSLLAYDPSDKEVPFQYSGYGSSGDAFKLADGLITGYDYQVVTAGETNYLIYTISRKNAAHAVDNTMLVLSKLQLTSEGGKDSYGLVNPLDAQAATPYILLDTKSGADDGTGDLDFRAWADGDVIHAAWVSYAEKANITAGATKPDGDPPKQLIDSVETEMDTENYAQFTAPSVPAEPAAPVQADYYTVIDAAAYEALDNTEKADYTPTGDGYAKPASGYADYPTAKSAYDAACTQYQQDLLAYNVAQAAADVFDSWRTYFATISGNVQSIAANAAKNTVVKTASFDTKSDTGFTEAKAVSGDVGSLVYLPGGQGDGSVTVYARAVPMTSAEKQDAEADYKTYLANIGYDPDGTTLTGDDSAKSAKRTIGSYRLATQVGMWDAYGKGTDLYVAVGETPCDMPLRLAENQILDNFEVAQIDGVYYLAYTTSEKAYTDDSGNAVADVAEAKDMVTIKRLFLRTFTVDGVSVTWTNHGSSGADASKAVLLRTLYDFDVNEGTDNKDGLYTSGGVQTGDAYNDPYFSNLKFLSGKLGESLGQDVEEETFTLMSDASEAFLLFEMNGASYVIREGSLKSIVGSEHKGKIIPFFAYDKVKAAPGARQPKTTHSGTTGRSQVTIGADGDGNVSAVYVAPVTGTGNNAVYLSKFDPETAEWGVGVMLAMNHMDVYEESLSADWNAEELSEAYLGAKGGMDEFTFGNLQIALGQTKSEEVPGGSATSNTDAASDKSTLLILAQGTTAYLDTYEDGGKQYIGRMSNAKAELQYQTAEADSYWKNRKPGVGVYALSFGVGAQDIGEETLTFADYDFTAGAYLYSTLSFTNTGDVSIRASEEQPVTVTLRASGDGLAQDVELARWKITENIIPGQKVKLSGDTELSTSLPQGAVIIATVAEDDFYQQNGGTPFNQTTGTLLTVEDRPELGFESLSIKPTGVDASGNVVLKVDGLVGNRGTKNAADVMLQFSYDSGEKDSEGNPVFKPLDVDAGTLEIGEHKPLSLLSALPAGAVTMQNIDAGYGRKITGTIKASPDKFKALTDSLSLHVEIFSGEDAIQTDENGLMVAQHADYNAVDNLSSIQVEHDTFFRAANKVVVPMGNTMHLPMSLSTTTGDTEPQIIVTEFPDAGGGSHLGVLYYQPGSYADGTDANAALVLAPSSIGSGLIRVQDTNTNGFYDIAYTVTEPASGINIFNDTTVFAFRNSDGTAFDASPGAGAQSWKFRSAIDQWGADKTAPYLDNLSMGKAGASFTFDTKAQSIDLVFSGKVKVESTFPGFAAQTIEAEGGDGNNAGEHASVRFGTNATNYTHTVTITVLSGAGTSDEAAFDRVVESFGSAGTPAPAEDDVAPHIYWSRSFPDTASIDSDSQTPVSLTAYVLDDGQLASVTLNGKTYTEATANSDNGCWQFPMSITQNGTIQITAIDTAGNRTARTITVDWFNSSVTVGASALVPALDVALKKTDKEETEASELSDGFSKNDKAFIAAAATSSYGAGGGDADVTVEFITVDASGSGLTATPVSARTEGTASGMFPMASNGWYLVTARNPEPHSSEFSAVIVAMDKIDTDIPVVTLSAQSAVAPVTLDWSVTKENTGTVLNTIQSVTVNGSPMTFAAGQTAVSGSFQTNFGGNYLAVATDTAGNVGESNPLVLKDVPVALAAGKTVEDLLAVTNAAKDSGGSKANGSIAISADALVGGTYLSTLSDADLAAGNYVGSYEWLPVRKTDDGPAEQLADLLAADGWSTAATIDALEPGEYTLYVRDSQESGNTATAVGFPFTVGDETITVTAQTERTIGQDVLYIDWNVEKGAGALKPITSVTINGFPVYSGSDDGDTGADGYFPVLYAGAYDITATDGENTGTYRVEIGADATAIRSGAAVVRTDDPMSAEDDAAASLAVIKNPWSQAGDNGAVEIDPDVLLGGEYDASASDPEQNRYKGSYEWTLYSLEGFDRDAVVEELVKDWLKQHPEVTATEDIPEEDMDAIHAEADRLRQDAEETPVDGEWSSKLSYADLKAGAYKLLVRDKQNPNSINALSVALKLESDAVRIQTESTRAGSSIAKNGQIAVSASGGYGQQRTYEFIIRLVKDKDAAVEVSQLTDPLDPKQYPNQQDPAWQIATLGDVGLPNYRLFTDLASGYYQVAVRPMLGVALESDDTTDTMTDLIALYTVYADASAALTAAQDAAEDDAKASEATRRSNAVAAALKNWRDAEDGEKQAAWESYVATFGADSAVLAALEAWQLENYASGEAKKAYNAAVKACVTARIETKTSEALLAAETAFQNAEGAYQEKLTELQGKSAGYYDSDDRYWDNVATEVVYVDYVRSEGASSIQLSDLKYPDRNTVRIDLDQKNGFLSDVVTKQLIRDNATRDVVVVSASMKMRIPKGTLKAGDDVNQMLVSAPQTSGNVVAVTAGGASRPVAWSSVSDGVVEYIASQTGRYEVTNLETSFADVPESHWGYDSIRFAAARGLFAGTGEGMFEPNGVMTRAMFVTVLGRMAGVDAGSYTTAVFDDVEPDSWYGPYVAWVAEHGVANGVGNGRFDPNSPVTREQICAMLCRYLDNAGMTLPKVEKPAAFRDADKIKSWSADAVSRFRQSAIVRGDTDGNFNPTDNATRAEAATIFARMIKMVLAELDAATAS